MLGAENSFSTAVTAGQGESCRAVSTSLGTTSQGFACRPPSHRTTPRPFTKSITDQFHLGADRKPKSGSPDRIPRRHTSLHVRPKHPNGEARAGQGASRMGRSDLGPPLAVRAISEMRIGSDEADAKPPLKWTKLGWCERLCRIRDGAGPTSQGR